MTETPYYKFSDFLKNKYGKKIYKIPVNIPCGCPNRDGTKGFGGCIFCGEEAAGFETLESSISVEKQLTDNIRYMGPKYRADGFIAYFQNYSNTYLDFDLFKSYMESACIDKIAAIYISTRPDCVGVSHAEYLRELSLRNNIDIVVELGLQSTSNKTLEFLNRQHTAEDFFNTASMLKGYEISICAHMITDIPQESPDQSVRNARALSDAGIDQVKCHSLYILKDTKLGRMYEEGEITMLKSGDFINRTISFLRNLDKNIVIQRLMGRAPVDRTLFCNYGRSWRAVVDEITSTMIINNWKQGDLR